MQSLIANVNNLRCGRTKTFYNRWVLWYLAKHKLRHRRKGSWLSVAIYIGYLKCLLQPDHNYIFRARNSIFQILVDAFLRPKSVFKVFSSYKYFTTLYFLM